jgi:hypothetical protein
MTIIEEPTRIWDKHGFGMKPPDPREQADRRAAAQALLTFLQDETGVPPAAEQMSLLKGLFNRCHRQDQRDWFVVWQQLGRPGRRFAGGSAQALTRMRRAMLAEDPGALAAAVAEFRTAGGPHHLSHLLTGTPGAPQDGKGYLYVLSTRDRPTWLKIGYTNGPIETRLKEINRATGVVVPYGVRAIWVVADARQIEGDVHTMLAGHRMRPDREFFEIEFSDACALIADYVRRQRSEQ